MLNKNTETIAQKQKKNIKWRIELIQNYFFP